MAKGFSVCKRCKKSYDYDLYSGLCPHCGCFHRRPGYTDNASFGSFYSEKVTAKLEKGTVQSEYAKHIAEDKMMGHDHYSSHKTSSVDPHIGEMKRDVENYPKTVFSETVSQKSVDASDNINKAFKSIKRIALLVTLASVVYLGVQMWLLYNEEPSTHASVQTVEAYTDCGDGEYGYYIGTAYVLCSSSELKEIDGGNDVIPPNTALVAVEASIVYEGDDDKDDYYECPMPYVYDEQGFSEMLSPYDFDDIKDLFAIEHLVDEYNVYKNGEDSGYMLFAVDENFENLTVCLPCLEDGKLITTIEVNPGIVDYRR